MTEHTPLSERRGEKLKVKSNDAAVRPNSKTEKCNQVRMDDSYLTIILFNNINKAAVTDASLTSVRRGRIVIKCHSFVDA